MRIEKQAIQDQKKREESANSDYKHPSIFGINPNSGYINKFKINDGVIELK